MSDTPETDAHSPWRYAITTPDGTTTHFVPADFARKLERERDEAIAARKASAADWLNQIEQANARTSRALQRTALAERERDEARADCERLNRLLRAETALGQGEIDHWAALERERDEARNLADAAMCEIVLLRSRLWKARDRCLRLGRDRNLARKLADSSMLEADRLRAQLHKERP